uniref:Uncharacterized protein n=1 Tax=Avena sativa TaxID=4498 RepID=A0ACD6AE20_AVESA
MRVLRDRQQCVCVQRTSPCTAQHSSVTIAHVQQLWNEWEIQFLVLLSLSLQVFLFFSAGLRKRYRIRPVSMLLWLSYLSADSVAVFVLGRLTLMSGDPHHQLALFWAPFMLLHLGGQETITAFSMEDCALWKRHLWNLTTLLTLAIYVVCKQWRWDKQLVAPMVLMFISGTIKYAERTFALWRAGSWTPGSSMKMGTGGARHSLDYYLALSFSSEGDREKKIQHMLEAADEALQDVMEFFMDMKVRSASSHGWARRIKVNMTISSIYGAELAYKLTNIYLSLIYDHLYTKFGSLKGVFYRLTTLVLISTALTLFSVARPRVEVDAKLGGYRYDEVDVAISYILLVGAVTLEISSIFMWIMSSYWPYITAISYMRGGRSRASQCAGRLLFGMVMHLRPDSELEWSGKLQQYNMFSECIQKEQPVSRLEHMMRRVGIKQAYTIEHVLVSPEVKDVLLEKLCGEIANESAFTSFNDEWAASWAARQQASSSHDVESAAQRIAGNGDIVELLVKESAAQQALEYSSIQDMDFVTSVLLWHLVTDICLVADETPTVGSKFRSCSQHLSNYIIYLLARCKLMLDSAGYVVFQDARFMLEQAHRVSGNDRRKLIEITSSFSIPEGTEKGLYHGLDLPHRVHSVSSELLKSEAADYRWELITMVWAEMLFYIASNCGSGFHAKQLSAGGEFLTHIKLIVFLVLDFT